MTKTNFGFVATAAFATLAIDPAALAHCSSYTVTVIPAPSCGVLGPAAMTAHGINAAGNVCGGKDGCNGLPDPFYWIGGAIIQIPLPPTTPDGSARSINIQNQVVGTMQNYDGGGALRGFLWQNGTTIDLGSLPGTGWTEPHSINDAGIIVGESSLGIYLNAFRWERGAMTGLPLPVGPTSAAFDISDTGHICGWMGEFGAATAFIWHDGQTTDLGLLPGSLSTEARGINNLGQACGRAVFGPPLNYTRAFFWSDGQMQNLGVLPPYTRSSAWDMNDSGTVIGLCTDQNLSGEPFIWHTGVMTALNDLIPESYGITMVRAFSINNAGQIAGDAHNKDGDLVAVILTPVPEMPGDFNCDSFVNVSDLLGVINHWGYPTPNLDFNSDGTVSLPDLLIVLDNWTL